ncbi:polybeta-D-mannuronate C5 epimerase 3 [Asticcacaulis biprosthecium C19]|uniref:Polybeta-D-mannuronate C5 epimerase 3 n=1 Tax=Asticcacaulis biprosthecium C19 TaxID=715226 RepID=F4QIE6_9CAUL|nr:glycosyl hydrolase family 28-related protein [Asticcacaulis biprosthecium]EGF92935.1 polybeta-D-mannuronate C5 epimerase 3 [Asticcacaulis biprosthecium C19]
MARKTLMIAASLAALALSIPAWAQEGRGSVYLTAPNDRLAITVKGVGDGKADDTAEIQAAIDAAAKSGAGGMVWLPSGRYRITKSLVIPPAVRLFGVGPTRPVLLLADRTPGFDQGVATMVIFSGSDQYNTGPVPVPVPSARPYSAIVRDANSGTFYSALSNIDFEMGKGNPAAAGVRMRLAQHAFLSHIDFRLDSGFAGIYQAGNVVEDVHFYGGRYGIVTEKTSPAWQFTLIDSTFDGQREAAIREHEVDLTLINISIKNTPVGIDIDRGYSDSLWGKDVRFENVSKAAVVISNESSPFTQIGFDNAVATGTPVFARFRDTGRTLKAPGANYRVRAFNYGLKIEGLGQIGQFDTNYQTEALAQMPKWGGNVLPALPPVAQWVDVRTQGVVGDGVADDTVTLQKAIDTHRVIYLPMGHYRVSDTLRLRSDTVLIALHPSLTQITLTEETPAYQGVGSAKALIESASGGNAIITGLGLFTGGVNPRATALLWKAGERSLVEDIRIHGGHGTFLPDGKRVDFSDPKFRMDGQHPGIWVTDGGGGYFVGNWTPNTMSDTGFYVSNTKTPGHVYELSAEHHHRHEIVLDGVENWEFLSPQTEQEVIDGLESMSLEVRNSKNILFANYHAYRVTRSLKPATTAVKLYNVENIRFRNMSVNAESGYATCDTNGCGTYLRASKFPFENAITDMTNKLELRERQFAVLDVTSTPPAVPTTPVPAGLEAARVEKLEGDFYSISGGAVDAKGNLYFVDKHFHRIYRWSKARGLEVVSDEPLDPVNLAVDKSGHLMVLSSDGPEASVYSFDPWTATAPITRIAPTLVSARTDAVVALPGNLWNNGEFRDQLDPKTYEFTTLAQMFARDVAVPKTHEYVSPDGSLVLPAFRVYKQGKTNFQGWRWSDSLETYGFVTAKVGDRVTVSNGSEQRIYSGLVGPGGSITDVKALTDRGGESVAVDAKGRLFVANGQIFVYDAAGKALGRIDTPERPLQLIFGGENQETLFILTHHSLYSLSVKGF